RFPQRLQFSPGESLRPLGGKAIHATTELRAEASSARLARRFVDATLAAWSCTDLTSVTELLTTELVTNALLHAGTSLRLHLHRHEDGVRVEVEDGSSHLPMVRSYDEEAQTGRGLVLVEALAAAWGADQTGQGKVVWFEVSA
ncbi:MAG: ATP-binding protein, partial [Actinomycetota bacterium]|nr:ATP-binding protein [Actinomycetota bacterium]